MRGRARKEAVVGAIREPDVAIRGAAGRVELDAEPVALAKGIELGFFYTVERVYERHVVIELSAS